MYNFNMKNIIRKIIAVTYFGFLLMSFFLPLNSLYAQANCVPPQVELNGVCVDPGVIPPAPSVGSYHLLSPLPCPTGIGDKPNPDCSGGTTLTDFNPGTAVGDNSAFGSYLNLMIKIFIGICAILAVIMIVMGGIEYMTSELISNKEHGKERILGAVFGLLLALGAYTILNQINPNILNTDFGSITNQVVEVNLANDSVWQPTGSDGNYTNGGLKYTPGQPWINNGTVGGRAGVPIPAATLLASYDATVYNQECTTVGQPSCTSTAGLNTNILQTIYDHCTYNNSGHCAISIQGGTEFWAHGGSTGVTSHGIGSPTVDLGLTDGLNTYIKGGTQIDSTHWTRDSVNYYFEGNHWHAYIGG